MRTRIAAILAGLLMGLGGAAIVATPAMATPSWNELAIYAGKNWSGSEYRFYLPNYNYACVTIGGSWTDRTQSIYLNGTGYATFYTGTGCSGNVVTTPYNASPWKRCTNDGAYGPWFGGCDQFNWITPSSFYYVP